MDFYKNKNNITTGDDYGSSYNKTPQTSTENDLLDIVTYVCTGLTFLFSLLGITTNILNIYVYCKQGIGDSVNITFIALSFWDLLACVFSFLTLLCYFWETYIPVPSVNVLSVQFVYLGYTRGLMYDLATLDTVYLTIERTTCILLPFKVKDIFTTTRVSLINLIICIFGLVCFSPAWASQGLIWVYDAGYNVTRLSLWLSHDRRYIDLYIDTFIGMVLPMSAQIMISISAAFMIHGVRNSSKFRHQATSLAKSEHITNKSVATNTPASHLYKDNTSTNNPVATNMPGNHFTRDKITTNKDLKLTKVVILLAVIFFVCNSPVFIVAFVRVLIPEIDIGKEQYQLYTLLYGLVYLSNLVNATVNIIVYYTVSTKYRKEIVCLFRWTASCRTSISIPLRC